MRVYPSEATRSLAEPPESESALYRRRVEECWDRAMASADADVVMVWLDLAAAWNELIGRSARWRSATGLATAN